MDPRAEIAALRPLLVDERADKIDRVAAGRLGGVVVVLENLTDPHNGGAAVRSCEAIGVLEMRVVGGRFKLSERVTQGCDKWLEIAHDPDIDTCARTLKARGFRLYATVPGAKTALEELDPLAKAAFLVGNEHEGLTDRARALADCEVTIPLYGFSQSVNLSVATAVTVYTHAHRRRQALGRAGDLDDDALCALRARYYRRDIRGADKVVARFVPPEGAG